MNMYRHVHTLQLLDAKESHAFSVLPTHLLYNGGCPADSNSPIIIRPIL
jgi:hypothetical protein